MLGTGFAAMLQQLLCICYSLQVSRPSNFGNVILDHAVNFTLHEQLTQLHLAHLTCNMLKLAHESLTHHLRLKSICCFSLPHARLQLAQAEEAVEQDSGSQPFSETDIDIGLAMSIRLGEGFARLRSAQG